MAENLKSKRSEKSEAQDYISEKGGCNSAALSRKYAVRVTEAVKETIHGDVQNDPVAKQYIPQSQELKILPEERVDPIGDDAHKPVKGLVHRYPDRVLLKLANVCAVYCRYCFRREKVGPGGDILDPAEQQAALDYIRANKDIGEVILTGGDPLVLSARKLSHILDELEAIEHVKIIRIHSRVPIADPKRMTPQVIKALKRKTPVYMVVHINHAQEITEEVKQTLQNLSEAGCILLSQSVLLKGVNDKAEILEELFKSLVAVRVKPYYLHHPDLAPGTSHFRLSIKEGQKMVSALQGRMSGICMPSYMLDIPGGYGKVPINSCYLEELEEGAYMIEDYKGVNHHYPPKDA